MGWCARGPRRSAHQSEKRLAFQQLGAKAEQGSSSEFESEASHGSSMSAQRWYDHAPGSRPGRVASKLDTPERSTQPPTARDGSRLGSSETAAASRSSGPAEAEALLSKRRQLSPTGLAGSERLPKLAAYGKSSCANVKSAESLSH